jgi:CheY-like chemotaxis protein/HPt (histidine-containing phosphotransfer) domain-containing protein
MLTASDEADEASRYRDTIPAEHLVKPISRGELLESILRALGKLVEPPSDSNVAAGAVAQPQRPMRILLAEDDPVNQETATELLKTLGHTVTIATTGREAVEALSKAAFDLVFMDIHMPEMGGLDAAAEIRRQEAGSGRHLPIVAMTANVIKGVQRTCLDAGMDDYVSKPVSGDGIAKVISKLLPADGQAPDQQDRPATRQRSAPGEPDQDSEPIEGAEQASADSPIIDSQDLLRRCMNKPEIANRVLHRFEQTARDTVGRIEALLDAGDTRQAGEYAHSLKCAAASISAERLRAKAVHVERLCKAGAEAAGRTQITELKVELEGCLAEIHRICPDPAPAG